MGKDKLRKYSEFEAMPNTFGKDQTHLRGQWAKKVFNNNRPITLELACGKGEYTLGLAALHPQSNYIGIDIKGNRMWKGAGLAIEQGLSQVAFLRAQIDHITEYFEPGEISEIWILFPDPQPGKKRAKKRLIHERFIKRYQELMPKGGRVHLKTDSELLYYYALEVAQDMQIKVEQSCSDVYALNPVPQALQIQTFYEKKWLKQGLKIKYVVLSW